MGSVSNLLCTVLQVDQDDEIVLAYRLTRSTMDYRKGHHFLTDIKDDEHVFGEVDCFVCRKDDNSWHILLHVYETICYVDHLHSYAIRQRNPLTYQLLTFSDLRDHHAVCSLVKCNKNGKVKFVRTPYHVL
jgi:hypothetical protein